MGSILNPYNDELYHHGILGMKWGIRRFQNKDGTRTPLGKKRYAENDAGKDERIAEAQARKVSPSSNQKQKPLSPRQQARAMDDAELKAAVSRLSLEKQYAQLYNELNPEKKSFARKFIDQAIDASVKSVTDTINRELGNALSAETSKIIADLKKQMKKSKSGS